MSLDSSSTSKTAGSRKSASFGENAGPSKLAEAKAAARSAKLHYVSDAKPGITRSRKDKGWVYQNPDQSVIKDAETIERINKLAIPPAYEKVWICKDAYGHLQATGIDARGRKQYRYHPQWRQVRDSSKYEHVLVFGRALPKIRRQVDLDLKRHGLPREKVLATLIRLMETTLIRVGNEEYARENRSFGLTTLRNRHVRVAGKSIHMDFKAKSGVHRVVDLSSPKLAQIVKKLRDLPGQELFQYLDPEGERHAISSHDVNDYLKEISGEDVTAKDFRTWAGTQLAALALAEVERFDTKTATKSAMLRVIESVAERLGNTPSVCRKCYIHPGIFEAYLDGGLVETLRSEIRSELDDPHDLTTQEAAIMALLEHRITAKGMVPDDSSRQKRLSAQLHASIDKETGGRSEKGGTNMPALLEPEPPRTGQRALR